MWSTFPRDFLNCATKVKHFTTIPIGARLMSFWIVVHHTSGWTVLRSIETFFPYPSKFAWYELQHITKCETDNVNDDKHVKSVVKCLSLIYNIVQGPIRGSKLKKINCRVGHKYWYGNRTLDFQWRPGISSFTRTQNKRFKISPPFAPQAYENRHGSTTNGNVVLHKTAM